MKCNSCEHQRVCYLYRLHISKLQNEGIDIEIKNCKEFDEIK